MENIGRVELHTGTLTKINIKGLNLVFLSLFYISSNDLITNIIWIHFLE